MIGRYLLSEMEEIWREEKKIEKWIEVEEAVLEAQVELGIVPEKALASFREKKKGFSPKEILRKMKEYEKEVGHEIVAFLMALEEEVGREGRYLHFGLTSSDIIDTANALLLRDAIQCIERELVEVIQALLEKAEDNLKVECIGRTHGVHAEPTSLGLKFLSFASEFGRSLRRLRRAKEEVLYGKISGAVGNYSFLTPEVEKIALRKLGLNPEPISSQIIPRDRYAYLLSQIAILGASLERLATEIRNLARTEIEELMEPFGKKQRGSSAMPHKRNPVRCERICGLARLLRGYLLTALENINLWHERDISHSSNERFILPGSTSILFFILREMKEIVKSLEIDHRKVRKNLELSKEFSLSEGLLLLLIEKGIPRQEAYQWVKETAFNAKREGISFLQAAINHERIRESLTEREINNLKQHDFLKFAEVIFDRVREILRGDGI